MKTRLTFAALICCLALPVSLPAQAGGKADEKKAPAPKTPADLAFDAFNKARGAPAAKTQAGFGELIAAGMAYITAYPTHSQINTAVNNFGTFANSIDSKQPALRTSYASLLKLEIANQRYKDGVTDPAKAALAALDAVVADWEMRAAPSRDTLATLREKIDALAETPGGGRFLADRERSFAHLMVLMNQAPRAEEALGKLAKHPEKSVSDMAKQELNLFALRKTPFELKFTALDGKPADLAALRGKVVALYFWSTTNKQSRDQFEALKEIYANYRKRGFEIVTVNYDKTEDREKVLAAVKEARLQWPVHFDGTGSKAFGKLNAYSVPRLMVFDQQGLLQTPNINNSLTANVPVNQLEAQIKRLLKIK